MKIVEALNEIYFKYETWHEEKISEAEITKYHSKLLGDGNILTVLDGDVLAGYVEFWRITYEQFGRILCHDGFSAYLEDVQRGPIAYVANTFVRPEYRNSRVAKELREKFIQSNEKCTHFVGEALRKKCQPVKVFKRKEIFDGRQ